MHLKTGLKEEQIANEATLSINSISWECLWHHKQKTQPQWFTGNSSLFSHRAELDHPELVQLLQDIHKQGSLTVLGVWLHLLASRYLVAAPFVCLKLNYFRLFSNSKLT